MQFDHSDPRHRKARMLRTRAIAAGLRAEQRSNSSNAAMWALIAQQWKDLADIAERAARHPMTPS